MWRNLELGEIQRELLRQLTERILYFGRAEGACTLRLVNVASDRLEPNCKLQTGNPRGGVPVLAPRPEIPLREDVLLSSTDAPLVRGSPVRLGAPGSMRCCLRSRRKCCHRSGG